MFQTKVSNAAGRNAQSGFRLMLVGMLVAVSATVALSAWAQPGGGPGMMGGPGMGGQGMMGGRGMHGGMFDGAPEHMGRRIDHMLDGLNATDAQRSQIKQIAQAAAADLQAQREAGRALRQKSMEIFTAPNVDAAAAESMRQQMLAQHDQASRRMLQAMLDVSGVLTPEQRAKIGERMKQRGAMMQERMQRHAPANK
jgi:Spy/CpxP family protein refolding chaperone